MEAYEIMRWVMTIMIIGVIGYVIFNLSRAMTYLEAEKKACEKINMENYHAQDSTFCVDNNGNAHYVKIDCKEVSLFNIDCTPRIISIGDIRTRPT